MGAVITFPEGRALRAAPLQMPGLSATVIILPVIRIERENEVPGTATETTKSPSGRKRRRPASRP
jgi:hypothetical protein